MTDDFDPATGQPRRRRGAIVALLGVVLAGRTGTSTAIGGWIWLVARAVYLPIYAIGTRGLRTAVFLTSVVGLGMVLWPLLVP